MNKQYVEGVQKWKKKKLIWWGKMNNSVALLSTEKIESRQDKIFGWVLTYQGQILALVYLWYTNTE